MAKKPQRPAYPDLMRDPDFLNATAWVHSYFEREDFHGRSDPAQLGAGQFLTTMLLRSFVERVHAGEVIDQQTINYLGYTLGRVLGGERWRVAIPLRGRNVSGEVSSFVKREGRDSCIHSAMVCMTQHFEESLERHSEWLANVRVPGNQVCSAKEIARARADWERAKPSKVEIEVLVGELFSVGQKLVEKVYYEQEELDRLDRRPHLADKSAAGDEAPFPKKRRRTLGSKPSK